MNTSDSFFFATLIPALILVADLFIRIGLSLRVVMQKRSYSITMAWLLITNMVFGFAMGWVYGRLVEREKRAARMAPDTVPAH